jgi:hypothetical protein
MGIFMDKDEKKLYRGGFLAFFYHPARYPQRKTFEERGKSDINIKLFGETLGYDKPHGMADFFIGIRTAY